MAGQSEKLFYGTEIFGTIELKSREIVFSFFKEMSGPLFLDSCLLMREINSAAVSGWDSSVKVGVVAHILEVFRKCAKVDQDASFHEAYLSEPQTSD